MNDTTRADRPVSDRTLILLISLSIFLGFFHTLFFTFIFDDHPQILDSPYLSAPYIPEYFVRPLNANYYRPVFMLYCFIIKSLFALNSVFWHLSVVLIHAAVAVLFYGVVRRLAADSYVAAMAALIFAFHPGRVESVAWVSGVTDPLLAFFVLSAFYCYLRGVDTERKVFLGFALLLHAIALLAKEPAVMLPAIVAIHGYLTIPALAVKQRVQQAFRAAAPFIVTTAMYLLARILILRGLGHPVTEMSLTVMVLTWPKVLWFYVRHYFWPFTLSPFYDIHEVSGFADRGLWLPLAGVAAVLAGITLLQRRFGSAVSLFGLLWFAIFVVPVLNIRIFNHADIVHDRYLYLPSMGLALVAALVIRRLPVPGALPLRPFVLKLVVAMIIVSALVTSSFAQSQFYRTDLLFYFRGWSVSPDSEVAGMNLGVEMLRRGKGGEAFGLFDRVVRNNPHNWMGHYNMGYLMYLTGNHAVAERELKQVLALNDHYAPAHGYLALTLLALKRPQEALQEAQKAIRLVPNESSYYVSQGLAQEAIGDRNAAAGSLRTALRLRPQYPEAAAALSRISK